MSRAATTLFVVVILSLLVMGSLLVVSAPPMPPRVEAGFQPTRTVGSPAASLSVPPSRSAPPLTIPVTLSEDGVDPTAVGLSWTQSTSGCFSYYDLGYSPDSAVGPWTSLVQLPDPTQTEELIYDIPTAATFWYRIQVVDCTGSAPSNVVGVTQPALAHLTATNATGTSVVLSWTNSAVYSGLLYFGAYVVEQTELGGSTPGTSVLATIIDPGTRSLSVQGLSVSNGYSFFVETQDECCAGTFTVASDSNVVTIGIPSSLASVAAASPIRTDVGQRVSLSCTASGGAAPYTYRWDFGDGTNGTGQVVSHQYWLPGNITAVCTVTDFGGSTTASAALVEVSLPPVVSIVTARTEASPGTDLGFSAVVSGGSGTFVNFTWNFGDGTISSGARVDHIYTVSGVYQVVVSVTDSNGASAVSQLPVSIAPLAVNGTVSPSSGEPGQLFVFTASASGGAGAPFSYTWDLGDGSVGVGPMVNHTYVAGGSYTIGLTVVDALGTSVSFPVSTVLVRFPLGATIAVSPAAPTVGEATRLVATVEGGSGSTECSWSFGDASEGQGCDVTHTWTAPGTYTVALTVADGQGESNSSTFQLTVTASPSSSETPSVLGPTVAGIPALVLLIAAALVAIVVVAVYPGRRPNKPAPPTAGGPGSADRLTPPPTR